MGTYVLGGAVLFAIGFITYEIFEGIKEVKTEAAEAKSEAQNYIPSQQTVNTSEDIGLALAVNPVTLPFFLAYETYEAL